MLCGTLAGGKALLLAVGFLLFLSTLERSEGARPPRATQIGSLFVLVIRQERSDPGDRRPR
jgi:hypothetical protein